MAEKEFYKIGEAAKILALEPYVLRFWETEFPDLKPIRTPKGQRKYSKKHLDLLQQIKHLLYERKMTIEGARDYLKEGAPADPYLVEIKRQLLEIRKKLT